MKFGVFLPNGSNGYLLSSAAPLYEPTFKHNLEISLEAERQGLDFVLSMMKFRGFGGKTGYWDSCLESFTLMSAIGAATSKIGLFPSVALLSAHPAIAARMVATIDDVSGGRCGLNVVTGWNRPEYSQMGLWPGDEYFDQRYEYAAEYLDILEKLWTQDETTYEGKFFSLENCKVSPKPSRAIPIVCAGQSPRGIEFTASYGNQSFVTAEPSALKAMAERMRTAAEKANRKVGIYALFALVIATTDAEARLICDDIVRHADMDAIMNVVGSAQLDTNTGGTSERSKTGLARSIEDGNLAFMGMPVIYGSPATVALRIKEIADETGVDGMLFSWPDFVPGVRLFGEKVLPFLHW